MRAGRDRAGLGRRLVRDAAFARCRLEHSARGLCGRCDCPCGCLRPPARFAVDCHQVRFAAAHLAREKGGSEVCVCNCLRSALCFALGYRVHLIFESKFPLLYLLLAVGSWPLLHRALPDSENWILSGLLSAVLYLSATLVPFFYDLSLVKQYQSDARRNFLFIAIWRDDSRVFWALPLVLLFDMQNGARLCALIVVAESLVGVFRRRMPIAIVPAAVTAVVGVTVTAKTAFYPFDDRLYNISDAVGVFMTPVVLMAGFVALMILWTAASRKPPDAASPVALDRMLVYAASVVVMAARPDSQPAACCLTPFSSAPCSGRWLLRPSWRYFL